MLSICRFSWPFCCSRFRNPFSLPSSLSSESPILAPLALFPEWTSLDLPCGSWLAVYMGPRSQPAFTLAQDSTHSVTFPGLAICSKALRYEREILLSEHAFLVQWFWKRRWCLSHASRLSFDISADRHLKVGIQVLSWS